MIDAYLREKITTHVAGILDIYFDSSDKVALAVEEIMEAIENEMIWAQPLQSSAAL